MTNDFIITEGYDKVVDRFNRVMDTIGVEYMMINDKLSELAIHPEYYGSGDTIKVTWLLSEAKYWLSCYYEDGNCRSDDRYLGADEYKRWRSEVGKLKRLVALLSTMDGDLVIATRNQEA